MARLAGSVALEQRMVDGRGQDVRFGSSPTPQLAATSSAYVVQRTGETLETIAKAVYGDASYATAIRQANALADGPLQPGQVLTLPSPTSLGAGSRFSAATLKPYDPSLAVGDTSPNLPAPSASGGDGCGGFGQVLEIVVVVVVSSYAPGAGNLLDAAITAVVADVAAQVVGNIVGTRDGFSLKEVVTAAVTAGATEGIAQGLELDKTLTSPSANQAAKAAIRSAVGQGINVAVGLQDHFSWTQVAASALASAGAGEVTGDMDAGMPRIFAYSLTKQAINSALTGKKASVAEVVGDVLDYQLRNGQQEEKVIQAAQASTNTTEKPLGNGLRLRSGDAAAFTRGIGLSPNNGGLPEVYVSADRDMADYAAQNGMRFPTMIGADTTNIAAGLNHAEPVAVAYPVSVPDVVRRELPPLNNGYLLSMPGSSLPKDSGWNIGGLVKQGAEWVLDSMVPSAVAGENSSTVQLSLGINERYKEAILLAASRTNLDPAAIASVVDAEAAKIPGSKGLWNPNSENARSGAAGLTQFLTPTWKEMAETPDTYLNSHARNLGYVSSENKIITDYTGKLLDLRKDPTISIATAAEYDASIYKKMENAGIIPRNISIDQQAQYLYLGHHEGYNGAKAIINGTLSDSRATNKLIPQNIPNPREFITNATANGGSTASAYTKWLWDYTRNHITPSKFRQPGA